MKYVPLSQRKRNMQPIDTIDDIMERISTIESGGRYDALGPEVKTGMYAGEKALGKYQIMPGNLPEWSKEALGREVTSEEFLANPELQDQIARHRMSQIYEQYGNGEDVASVWFTGRPKDKAGNVSDVTGTTASEYVSRFSSAKPNNYSGTSTSDSKMVYVPLSKRYNRQNTL